MAQNWNPRDVLNVRPDSNTYPCVGMGTKKPCGNYFISSSDREEARAILKDFSKRSPTSQAVLVQLERLAYLTLCPRWHRDTPGHAQVQRMRNIWAERIRIFNLESEKIERAQNRAHAFITPPSTPPRLNYAPSLPSVSVAELVVEDTALASPPDDSEEESDFEDSGIDLEFDATEESSNDVSDEDQTEEVITSDHTFRPAFSFGQSRHPIPFEFSPAIDASRLLNFDVNTPIITQASGLLSLPVPGRVPFANTAVESLVVSIDSSSSDADHQPMTTQASETISTPVVEVAPATNITVDLVITSSNSASPIVSETVDHLSGRWQSWQMTIKNYATRYSLFNFKQFSWKEVQCTMGGGTGLGIAGFIGASCVLWWTLRGRQRMETLSSMLWAQTR